MKTIVIPTMPINLIDIQTGTVIVEDRPTVVLWTPFLEARTGAGQLRVIHAGLPDTATDEDFVGFLKASGDVDLAVASFVSQFTKKRGK